MKIEGKDDLYSIIGTLDKRAQDAEKEVEKLKIDLQIMNEISYERYFNNCKLLERIKNLRLSMVDARAEMSVGVPERILREALAHDDEEAKK